MIEYVVQITLLAENLTYDFYVPESMQIGVLSQLCGQAFAKLTNGRYIPTPHPILYDQTSGIILDPNMIVHQTSVRNGSKLLLY